MRPSQLNSQDRDRSSRSKLRGINPMRMNPIQWTGNPFVDTGVAVMIARAKSEGLEVSEPSNLTSEVLQRIVGDGVWLADANRRLKSYSLVLGSNSPLMNSSTNPALVLSNLKLKIIAAKQKISSLDEQIAEEEQGKNRDKKLLELSNKRDKAVDALKKEEEKLKKRSPAAKQEDSGVDSQAQAADDAGLREYLIVIKTLLRDVVKEKYSKAAPCECTGVFPASDAMAAASKIIRRCTKSDRSDFVVGRDWFPLAGSIGNDAQALPAASRAPQISALALLAVQFLPLGAMLLNGQLVLFQSTEPSITQLLVNDIYRGTEQQLSVASDKVEIRGAKAGTTPTTQLLLDRLDTLRQHKRISQLPSNTSLNLWLFSNSGTSASADVIEVPHPALSFLWEASRDHSQELKRYLQNEKKLHPEAQLLSTIRRERDYSPFYPYKGQIPASIELFELYQEQIMRRSPEVLRLARFVASKLHAVAQSAGAPKDFKQLEKAMGDAKTMRSLRPRFKALFAEWAENGDFTLDDYALLFPSQRQPLRASLDGWRLVWFYMNHPFAEVSKPENRGGETMFTHPKVKRFAADVFDFYRKEIGLEKFRQRVLNGFRRGEIDNKRLQGWFIDLAERGYDGYSNEAWDDLCRDENGNSVTYEVRFQLRLELANLYAQATKAQA
jgi:hypothetical protein